MLYIYSPKKGVGKTGIQKVLPADATLSIFTCPLYEINTWMGFRAFTEQALTLHLPEQRMRKSIQSSHYVFDLITEKPIKMIPFKGVLPQGLFQ